MKIKLLLVDDHCFLREGLRNILSADHEISFIDEAGNGLEAVIKAGKNNPDVVVLDYEMPKYNGMYAVKELTKQQPGISILMLSMFLDKEHIVEAIQAGVKGYLCKEAKSIEIIQAIKALYNGKTWFKGEITEIITPYLIETVRGQTRHSSNKILTMRETQVIRLLAEGQNTMVIGKHLNISRRTVEAHKTNIYRKLNLKNTIELMRYAIRNNMVTNI